MRFQVSGISGRADEPRGLLDGIASDAVVASPSLIALSE
jgi:hypothetical protein